MQKTILVSLVTIGLLASVIGVGTYAFFSDTETSTGNTMTAGSLDLYLNNQNPWAGAIVTLADMKPSKTMPTFSVNVRVEDNPGVVYKMIKDVVCEGNLHPEPELASDPTDTINDLQNVTWFDLKVRGIECLSGDEYKVGQLVGQWIKLGAVTAGEVVPVEESFHMDATAGNEYQGDKCTFTEEYRVEQTNAPALPFVKDCTP
jgi:predicted ribosomally synthesized peptide with SipW-like signal peptide